jgi:epoxyqueuosine reductase
LRSSARASLEHPAIDVPWGGAGVVCCPAVGTPAQDESVVAWQGELVASLRRAGAALVGFGDLSCLPMNARSGLPRAISIAVALDPSVVSGLVSGPTTAYHAEYDRANAALAELAGLATRFIEARGFVAVAGTVTAKVVEGDGATALPHKTVATRAGLGWIGHSALLVTPEFGKSVRLASVLTDAPFICAEPVQESRCGRCRGCVDACPAGAVTGHPWSPGIARNRIFDAAACKKKASALAADQGIDVTICGICILACPWTRRYLRACGTPT